MVCRQLGYKTAIAGPRMPYFGNGFGVILINDVNCNRVETSLLERKHTKIVHYCGHSHDAGVVCGSKRSSSPFDRNALKNTVQI